ncbi:MBL fold metallo-hydrolase [Caldiplasma sukawensis]
MANCYIVKRGDETLLIDAGTEKTGLRISQYVKNNNISVDYVLLTHYHPDHVGGLKNLDLKDTVIYGPDGELNVINGKEPMKPGKSFISKLIASRFSGVQNVKLEPISNMKLSWIRSEKTPGHTPDSRIFVIDEEKVIFSGDSAVEKGGKLSVSKAFSMDYDLAQKSLREILGHSGYTVYPGHGKTVKIG